MAVKKKHPRRRRPSLARRRAAVKGWATRRQREHARRRAALKGAATRKRNAAKKRKTGGQRQKTKRSFYYAGSTEYETRGGAQQLQFDIKSNRKLTAKQIDDAIQYRALNERDMPGIRIRIVAWFDKRNRRHAINEKHEASYWIDLRAWIVNADTFVLDEEHESESDF